MQLDSLCCIEEKQDILCALACRRLKRYRGQDKAVERSNLEPILEKLPGASKVVSRVRIYCRAAECTYAPGMRLFESRDLASSTLLLIQSVHGKRQGERGEHRIYPILRLSTLGIIQRKILVSGGGKEGVRSRSCKYCLDSRLSRLGDSRLSRPD
jgi:hypothetical protein